MRIIVEIHGIRTERTDPSWPFRHELRTRATVPHGHRFIYRSEQYEAGLFPAWNHRVINPEQTGSLVWKLQLLKQVYPDLLIDYIAHSNGTNICVSTIKATARLGIPSNRAVLVGSALHSDLRRNGISELIRKRFLKQAIAYVSPKDYVVRRLDEIPGLYGSLGAKGFRVGKDIYGPRVFDPEERINEPIACRVFPDYSHSEYFDPSRINRTFDLMNFDLRLEEQDRAA